MGGRSGGEQARTHRGHRLLIAVALPTKFHRARLVRHRYSPITFHIKCYLPSAEALFRIPGHPGEVESYPGKKIQVCRYLLITSRHCTFTKNIHGGTDLQPGERAQVGAVLDVDIGWASTAAAVWILRGLCYGGHGRWVGSRSALGATLPVGHRSTSESVQPRRSCEWAKPTRPTVVTSLRHRSSRRQLRRSPAQRSDRVTETRPALPASPATRPFIDTPARALLTLQVGKLCFDQ